MEQKVISIIGPSGGVGKSTIAKELAIAYANTKYNGKPLAVCVIDASLGVGSQQALFRLAPKYYIEDWLDDLYQRSESMDDAGILDLYTWEYYEKYLSYSPDHKLFVLPTSMEWYLRNGINPGHIPVHAMNMLILALKKHFDVIIIDTGNNLSEVTFSAISVSDTHLLILTDEKRCLVGVGKLKQLLREKHIGFERFIAVLNQYPEKKSSQIYSPEEINQILLENHVAHILNYDKRTWTFNNMCDSLMLHSETTKLKSQLNKLAKALVPEFSELP